VALLNETVDVMYEGRRLHDVRDLTGVVVNIYARISHDKKNDEAGVARQVRELSEWVVRRGGTVGNVYIDNDKSLGSRGKRRNPPRPEFDRMLANTGRPGQPTMILATETQRFYRSPRQFVQLCEYAEDWAGKLDIVTIKDRTDLTTRQGRRAAWAKADHNFAESEDTRERVVLYNLDLVRQGEVRRTRRAFGWLNEEDHHPQEAALVAKALRDVVAGVPTGAIAKEWEAAGVVTPYWDVDTKGPLYWTNTRVTLTTILSNPRHAGHQVYKRQVVNLGRFKPIVEPEVWEAAQAVLKSRRTGTQRHGNSGRRPPGPFTGLLRCGKCGDEHKLTHTISNRGVPMWNHARQGCGLSIHAHMVEPVLWRVAVARASTPTFLAGLSEAPDDDGALAELERLRVLRDEIEEDRQAGAITRDSAIRQLAINQRLTADAEARLARVAHVDPTRAWLASNTLSADGATLPGHIQRNVLSLVYHLVRVLPAAPGRLGSERLDPMFIEEVQ